MREVSAGKLASKVDGGSSFGMFCILGALWPNRTVGIKPMEGRSARERMGGKTSQQHGWSDATLHHLITQVGKVRPKNL